MANAAATEKPRKRKRKVAEPDLSHIEGPLQSLAVPVEDLLLDPANVRIHPARNLETIAASLKGFRQQKPIVVDKDGIVRAGNGTLEAARALGWTHVAAVQTSLDGAEAIAFAIADNKTSDLGEWDFQGLGELFRGLEPELLDLTGFADFEIEPLLQANWSPPSIVDEEFERGDGAAEEFDGAVPDDHDPDATESRTLTATLDQWVTIGAAITRAREEGDNSAAEALATICDAFHGG